MRYRESRHAQTRSRLVCNLADLGLKYGSKAMNSVLGKNS